jgi:DNA-binding LytR/AlgR family response regulator
MVPLTFFLVFEIVLLSLATVVVLKTINRNKTLIHLILRLQEQNRSCYNQIKRYQENDHNNVLEITSENNGEQLRVQLNQIILVRSADNYIEIIYKDNGKVEKRLIRNTLKSIELQFSLYQSMVRCHRTCIVNLEHIEKLLKRYGSYKLLMKDFEEEIPVSRQYLIRIKEVISEEFTNEDEA